MVSQEVLISVALPVAAMAIVVGSVANVQDNTLAPGLDTLEAATSFGYPEVTIEEEEELRGIAVFNMLSAQNCLYSTHVYHRKERLSEDEKEMFEDLAAEYKPLEKVDGEVKGKNGEERTIAASELENSTFTYYGHGDVLREALDLEGFDGTCLGGKQISITESLVETNEVLKGMVDSYKFVQGLAPWNLNIGPSADNEELNRGALQGKYGRIEFEMDDTVLIDDPRLMSMKLNGRVTESGLGGEEAPDFIRGGRASVFFPEGYLRGESAGSWEDPGKLKEDLAQIGIYSASAVGGFGTGAYVGMAAAGFFIGGPAGLAAAGIIGGVAGGTYGVIAYDTLLADELDMGEHPGILIGFDQKTDSGQRGWYDDKGMYPYRDGDGVDWREDLNAFRVRMVNIPTVMGPSFSIQNARSYNDASLQLGYNYITKQANYVVCNQTQGFVQSNAGKEIGYDGKKEYQNDDPIYRDVVYPRIEATSWNPNCLRDAVWGDNDDYYTVDKMKLHRNFTDSSGDFKGPISRPLGYGLKAPLSEMKEDDSFKKEPLEDEMYLVPGTRVDLKQGLERASPKNKEGMDIGWWDKKSVYFPTYGIKREQCEKYRGEYDVTRMFTDNRRSTIFFEDAKADKDIGEPVSYEIVQEGDDHKVKLFSKTALSNIHKTYNVDRFSTDRLVVDFSLNFKGADETSDEGYGDIKEKEEIVHFYLDKPASSNPAYIWAALGRRIAALGSSEVDRELEEKEDGIAFTEREGAQDVTDLVSYMKDFGEESDFEDASSIPIPTERNYRLVLDKSDDEEGRIQLEAEFGRGEDAEYYPLFTKNYRPGSSQDPLVPINGIERLEIMVDQPGQGRGAEAVVTVDDVKVEGSVAGCPIPEDANPYAGDDSTGR